MNARRKSYLAMAQFGAGNGFIIDLLNVVVIVVGGNDNGLME